MCNYPHFHMQTSLAFRTLRSHEHASCHSPFSDLYQSGSPFHVLHRFALLCSLSLSLSRSRSLFLSLVAPMKYSILPSPRDNDGPVQPLKPRTANSRRSDEQPFRQALSSVPVSSRGVYGTHVSHSLPITCNAMQREMSKISSSARNGI